MKPGPIPEFVNATQLHEHWGISRERVRQLTVDGTLKQVARGLYHFRTAEVAYLKRLRDEALKARGEGSSDIKSARAREIELRIAQRERELIRLDEVLLAIDRLAGLIRTALAAFPARFAADPALRARIEEGLDEVLNQVADECRKAAANLRSNSDAPADDAEADARPVGSKVS